MRFIVSRKRCDLLAEVQPHVVAGRLDPVDLVGAQEEDAAAGLHDQAIELRRLGLDVVDEREQAAAEIAGAAALERLARVLQRLAEALLAERLQQVVERVHLEGAQRVLVVGGDEDHRRHPLGADRPGSRSKPSMPGICTSRKTRSGECCWIALTRLRAVAALADDLDVVFLLQQRQHALARHRLVVHDQGSDLVHATLSISDVGAGESGVERRTE